MLKAATLFATALVTAGCLFDQSSFRPLFEEDELVLEPSIEGTWSDEDGDHPSLYRIRARMDGGYELAALEDGVVAPRGLEIALGRVAGDLFWDATAAELAADDLSSAHLLPLHTFARIRVDGERLEVAPLSSDWVEAALADGRIDVPHAMVDGHPILNASPAELQRLVLAHADDEDAFREPLVLRRAAGR